jgi:hypothetical protein
MALDLTKQLPTPITVLQGQALQRIHQPIVDATKNLKSSYDRSTQALFKTAGLTPAQAVEGMGANAVEILNALNAIRNTYNAIASTGKGEQIADALANFTLNPDGTATYTPPPVVAKVEPVEPAKA